MAEILSVGIDIGTSTTQVVFSRISMENTAGYFSVPRISIIDKEVVYKSPVYLTPLTSPILIDGDGVRDIVEEEYKKAGYKPSDVGTGAVIITGESARKENAALVLEKLSSFAGEFVVSTAGPDLESIIAGKGSGAYQYSIDEDTVCANLDIGGGTTNIVVFNGGDVVGKACFDIGGRLIRMDEDGRLNYIGPSIEKIAKYLGINLELGTVAKKEDLKKITEKMGNLLAQGIGFAAKENLLDEIKTPGSSDLVLSKPIRKVMFSGGVADCIYKEEKDLQDFGDIGILFGKTLREGEIFKSGKVAPSKETIRATVIGAGSYTTSLSGSTIYYDEGIFPVKNIPALKLSLNEQMAFMNNKEGLKEKIKWFKQQHSADQIIISLPGFLNPSYEDLNKLARLLIEALEGPLLEDKSLIIVVEADIAKALGFTIKKQYSGNKLIAVIDSVKLEENDFVDIGKALMDGMVVPVIVKTLLFN